MKNAACNPVLPVSVCMADGEPHVFGDRVYLFGSHDTPGGESFCLEDYEFFSAPLHDLSNWTSRGTNYSAKQDPLYGENARYLYARMWCREMTGGTISITVWLVGRGRVAISTPSVWRSATVRTGNMNTTA